MICDIKKTYKNKTVLVTGHTGFKGSWLSLWLLEMGAKVIGYSLKPPTTPNLFEAIGLKKKLIHINGDIRDKKHFKNVLRRYHPEFIFHLAAQPLVGLSYKEPHLTYETNIMGTVNILEAVRAIDSVKVCIIVTSDKCYDNKGYGYCYKETDSMGGYDPYSSSKGCVELIVSAYRNSFFNPDNYGKLHNLALSSVRSGNIIGGGDWSQNRLIPDCVRFLNSKRAIIIRNPKSTRPWQYVLEPLFGYLQLGSLMLKEGKLYSGGWNFGPNAKDCLPVEDIAKLVIKIWGKGKYKIAKGSKFHEAKFLMLDTTKAGKYLNWKSMYNMKDILCKTVMWYRNYYGFLKAKKSPNFFKEYMYNYTLSQIEEYGKHIKEL